MKDFSHGRLDLMLSEQQAELARLAAPNCPGETHETTLFSVFPFNHRVRLLWRFDCDWWFAVTHSSTPDMRVFLL